MEVHVTHICLYFHVSVNVSGVFLAQMDVNPVPAALCEVLFTYHHMLIHFLTQKKKKEKLSTRAAFS